MNTRINLVNTSNIGKQEEFSRLFVKYGYSHGALKFKKIDLDEIDAAPEMVAAMKAVAASQLNNTKSILIDDTSLDIDGAPDAGVSIRKWLDEEPEKFKQFIGRPATFRCILAYALEYDKDQNTVCVAIGEVRGKISEPREKLDVKSFGFDPVFVPDGSDKTLAEAKPDEHNARALAVENLMKGQVKNILCTLPNLWTGKWQQKTQPKAVLFQPAPVVSGTTETSVASPVLS